MKHLIKYKIHCGKTSCDSGLVLLYYCSVFDASAVLPDDAQLCRQPLDLHDLQPQPRRGALQRLLPRGILLPRRRLSAQGRYVTFQFQHLYQC